MSALSDDKARDRAWLFGVLASAVLLSLLATRWTFDMWAWQYDELLFRSTAHWIGENLPSSLWAMDEYTRGVQRLNAWLLAFCLDVFGSPDGFRVARVVIVLSYATTVIPVWLLARAAGATRAWAAISALAAVLVPWAALTGTFLTEGLAYPLFGWACLAIWNAVVRCTIRADLLALTAIGGAMMARTGMVLLLVALAVAVVGHELRGVGGRSDLIRLPQRFARRHPVLGAVGLAGLLVLATGHTESIKGSWYADAGPRWGEIWHGVAYVVSGVASGVAFVPVLVALGFAATQMARPASARSLALAWLVIGTLVTFTLVLISGPEEERYIFYWALPCAVAFGVAASSRGASVFSLVAAAVLVIVSMGERVWRTEVLDIWGFVLFPAESFQARVVRLGIADRLPGSLAPGPETVSALVVAAAAVLAVLAAAALPRFLASAADRRGLGRAALSVGVLVVLAGAVQTGWAMHKFVSGGGGGRDLEARTTIERAVAGHEVGMWLPPAAAASANAAWEELRYFSPAVIDHYRLTTPQAAPRFEGEDWNEMAIDHDTGRIAAITPGATLPALMAIVASQTTAPLRGEVIARDPGVGVEVVRVARPASVRWVSGPSLDGVIGPGATEIVRVFPPFPPSACLRMQLVETVRRPLRFRIRSGDWTREVTPPPLGAAELLVPLRGGGARAVNVTALKHGQAVPQEVAPAGRVVPSAVVSCSGREPVRMTVSRGG